MLEQLEILRSEALERIKNAPSQEALEQERVSYLG